MNRKGLYPKHDFLLALGTFHLFFALILNPPGYFRGDETSDYQTIRNFS